MVSAYFDQQKLPKRCKYARYSECSSKRSVNVRGIESGSSPHRILVLLIPGSINLSGCISFRNHDALVAGSNWRDKNKWF